MLVGTEPPIRMDAPGASVARTGLLLALAFAGVFVGLSAEWTYAHAGARLPDLLRDAVVGWTFIGAGLAAWSRRPDNRIGMLMVAEGFAWFIGNFEGLGPGLVFSLSYWLAALNLCILAHLMMAFPAGTLGTLVPRLTVGATYALVAVGGFLDMVSYDPSRDGATLLCLAHCPANALLLFDNRELHAVIDRAYYAGGIALGLAFFGVIAHRWWVSTAPRRRVLMPVWVSYLVLLFVTLNGAFVAADGAQTHGVGLVLTWLSDLGQLAVPLAFLYGHLRRQLACGLVGDLVVEVGDSPPAARLRDALGRTLGDPSLELAFWDQGAGRYLTPEGRPVQLPLPPSGRVVALVEQGGRPHAVIIHDPALGDEHRLVEVVGAVARLGLENERLHAELGARLEEVRASRVRILEAADAERQRIERNLHDGAQQRLISVAMALGQAQAELARYEAQEPQEAVRRAVTELHAALADIRELAHGIQPAVLHLGLRAAVTSLAERSPIPIAVRATACRYTAPLEANAYYIVSEAVTNAIKHSAASQLEVSICECGEWLVVQVDDDGVGGADVRAGTGLQGLADRAAALGGHLD